MNQSANVEASLPSPDFAVPRARRTVRMEIVVLLVLFVAVVVRSAWIMDDAYISFRSVDNAVHGYGLRWNTFERVDAFTSPLWTLVMCTFTLVTRDVFYTSLCLQIALSLATACGVVFLARSRLPACAALAALTLSKAFVDYSTSGLENPLSHFLFVLFALAYLSDDDRGPAAMRRLGGIAALALVNRLDLVFLLGPCFTEATVTALWRAPHQNARRDVLKAIAIGAAPFAAWELFSFFYYGAWIPNSALAKLTAHVPRSKQLYHGAALVANSFVVDPLTPILIAAGAAVGLARGSRRERSIATGITLTVAYVVWVGGDHMSGRFFSVPFVAAVTLLARVASEDPTPGAGVLAFAGMAAAWMAGAPTLNDSYTAPRPACRDDIEDYQREWYPSTGLLSRGMHPPDHDVVHNGLSAREHPHDVQTWGGIGLAGYYAGPHVRVVDMYGLSDALLARLPIPDASGETYFKPGHFHRPYPDGYLETVRDGRNEIEHPALSAYYEKLALVTQGPLWSAARLVEAAKLSLGRYDRLLAEYEVFEDQKPVDASALPPVRPKNGDDAMTDCPSWWRPCAEVGATFDGHGLRVKLGPSSKAAAVELAVAKGHYVLVFWSHERELGRATVDARSGSQLVVATPSIPLQYGFDAVSILPEAGSDGGTLTYFALKP
jgi:arabinofuranosyltransferase